MRLFVAINPAPAAKEALGRVTAQLRQAAVQGRFTPTQNLHLTLAFLGETQRIQAACRAMDGTAASPFTLQFAGLGQFAGNAVCWMGVAPSHPLLAVQRRLVQQLALEGFVLEKRPFRPHLTLGRQVEFPSAFDLTAFGRSIAPISVCVEKLSLMRSERAGGRLVYTEMYSVSLKGGHYTHGF